MLPTIPGVLEKAEASSFCAGCNINAH